MGDIIAGILNIIKSSFIVMFASIRKFFSRKSNPHQHWHCL